MRGSGALITSGKALSDMILYLPCDPRRTTQESSFPAPDTYHMPVEKEKFAFFGLAVRRSVVQIDGDRRTTRKTAT
ncbi:hypothetical protein X772_12120 [Mesorhizobium sp. LSJC280B00]|nr:hypothetical protein X772_12120 [Mesorhizobium sp. LSJC280B00]